MSSLFFVLTLILSQSAELDDIMVVGERLSPLVSVTVEGDIPTTTLVRSDPAGIRCGASRSKYDSYGAPRTCWIRRPVGEVVHLQAENDAGFRIRWEGCEPTGDGRGCTVTSAFGGGNIKVSFTR
jgi:hypothetical protein